MIINHPHLGPRDASEFTILGDASLINRPDWQAGDADNGFYNYQYVILKKDGTLDHDSISGDFWQTENNYKVIVYYRDLGARYDKVIGFSEVSSTNITN